jgi:hypothetical protein
MGLFNRLKNTVKYELSLLKVTFGGFLRNPRPNEYIAQIDQHTAIIYNKGLYGFIHNCNYIQCAYDHVLYVSGKYYAVVFGTNLESDHGNEIIPTKQIENSIAIFIKYKNELPYHIIFNKNDILVFNYSIPNMMLGITSDGDYMGVSEETLELVKCQKFDQKTSKLNPVDYIYEDTSFTINGSKYTIARGGRTFEQLLLTYNIYSVYTCGGMYIVAITCANNDVWVSQLYKEILRIKPALH